MSDKEFPITGKVWFRESTQEWVLEIEGSINDMDFLCRHSQPGHLAPEDVPGLPTHYVEEPVAMAHVRETDTYLETDLEVLDGEFLQPGFGPIPLYLSARNKK